MTYDSFLSQDDSAYDNVFFTSIIFMGMLVLKIFIKVLLRKAL